MNDSGNEADTELEAVAMKDGYRPLVITFEGLNVKDSADDVSKWVINENLDFTYLSGPLFYAISY